MTNFVLHSLLIVNSLSLFSQVHGRDYGKVTCLGKTKVPEAKLLGSLARANCKIPPKESNEEAMGALTRCVFEYTKAYIPPSTFNRARGDTEFGGIFPKKYQASFKTMNANCLSIHSRIAKSSKEDKSGKTWVGMFRCYRAWYTNDLCQ